MSKALVATQTDSLTAAGEIDLPEQTALDAMVERLQHTTKCECGHPVAEHIGGDGPCKHEDGRGICSCGGYAEMSTGESGQNTAEGLVAAAGDLVWGPEDGLVDLLCDVDEQLREMDVYGYCACDATTDLTRVLVCDYDGGDCWVIPITIGADKEPVLAPMEQWLKVESGWVEVASESYAARIAAARALYPVSEIGAEQVATSRMTLHLTSLRAAGDVELLPEHQPGEVLPDVNVTPDAPVTELRGPLAWDAIFAPEGKLTDDFRAIAPGALTWRELPLSLGAMLDTPHADVVTNSQVCGRIDSIWREDSTGLIRASGVFDDGDYGREIARMVTDGTLRGISVDLAIHEYKVGPRSDYFDADGNWAPKAEATVEQPTLVDLLFGEEQAEPTIYVITNAVIGATTVCPFPAFAEANIEAASALTAGASLGIVTVTTQAGFRVIEKPAEQTWDERAAEYAAMTEDERVAEFEALVEGGLSDHEARATVWPEPTVLTASAEGMAPELPPAAWFADPGLEEPTALTVDDEGRIFGHAATWDSCHIGFADICVAPPSSEADYRYFMLGEVVCDGGERIACGQITLGTGHAGLDLARQQAAAHYDNTGTCVADVVCGEDEHGIWVAGAVRPNADANRVRELRAAKLSGDWRRVEDGGPLELVALLAVNVPGFPVPRAPSAVVASGDDGTGQVLSLVAAGIQGEVTDDDRATLRALADSAKEQ